MPSRYVGRFFPALVPLLGLLLSVAQHAADGSGVSQPPPWRSGGQSGHFQLRNQSLNSVRRCLQPLRDIRPLFRERSSAHERPEVAAGCERSPDVWARRRNVAAQREELARRRDRKLTKLI